MYYPISINNDEVQAAFDENPSFDVKGVSSRYF